MKSNHRLLWESAGGKTPRSWEFKTIEELLENPKSISVGVMYPGGDMAGGVPLIKVSDVKNGAVYTRPEFCVSYEVDLEYKRTRLNGTELLITLVGTPGDCVVVTGDMMGWNVARAIAVVRLSEPDLRSWLRYVLLSKPAKHLIDARLNTTVQKTLNLKDIRELGIPIPPLKEREQITKIIETIEKKAHLNRQTNQTLEQIAQAIFKSWFVDFEPVKAKIAAIQAGATPEQIERTAMCAISGKSPEQLEQINPETQQKLKTTAALFPDALVDSELGEIPEGWEANPLGDYVEIKRGGSPRPIKEYIVENGLPWVKIADATKESSPFLFRTKEFIKEEGLKKTVFLKKGTLILSNSATPGLPKFLELDACIHDGWLHFPKKDLFSDIYLFQLFLEIKQELIAQGNGSVFTNLKTDILRNQVVVVPSNEIINKFDATISLLFEKIKGNCVEINVLTEIRDNLLPKLLSGEISPGQIKTQVEAAC